MTALPPGFVWDEPQRGQALPPGFVLDAAPVAAAVSAATAAPETIPLPRPRPGITEQPGPVRGLMLGTQRAGAGLADLIGMPFDLTNTAVNVGLAGLDTASRAIGGPEVPFRFGMASDAIKREAGGLAERAGIPLVTPRTFGEKALGNVIEFGTGALTGGAGLARAAARRAPELLSEFARPRAFDPLLRPYVKSPVKTTAGDTAVGGAMGGALTASQEVPESIRSKGGGLAGATLDLGAMGLGALAGGAGVEAVRRAPSSIIENIRNIFPARGITFDPSTGLPTSKMAANKAAEFIQSQTHNPAAAAAMIRSRVAEFQGEGLPVPTTGLISGDTGLAGIERRLRAQQSTGTLADAPHVAPDTKAKYSFGDRDTALRDSAVENVNSLRPAGGDPERLPARAAAVEQATMEPVLARAEQTQGRQERVAEIRKGDADALAASQGRGNAASRNIDETYRQTRVTERDQNRALYEDPNLVNAPVPVEPLLDTAAQLRATGTDAAPLSSVVQKYVDRFRAQEVDDAGAVTRPGFKPDQQITMREANAVRAEIEADIQANLSNGEVVRQLRALKDTTAGYVDDLAASGGDAAAIAARAATGNFATRVQPNFRQGAGGRVDAKLKSDPNRTNFTESQTAGEFLTRPEDAQSLMRIAALRGNEAQVAGEARTWIMDQLSRTGVASNGAVDPARLARWRNINGGLIDQVPGMRGQVDDMLDRAQRGERVADRAAEGVRTADQNVVDTRRGIDQGVVGMAAARLPRDTVAGALSRPGGLRELRYTIGRTPEGLADVKAAVADYFSSRVSGVAPANVTQGTQNINFAQLVKEFDKHRGQLADIFSPEEMNALTRAQKVLEPLAERAGQATVGSITAESQEGMWRALRFGMYALTRSQLQAGGRVRAIRDALHVFSGKDVASEANRLIARMQFDPDLAVHLLERPIKEVDTPLWNDRLQKWLRRTEAAKETQRDE